MTIPTPVDEHEIYMSWPLDEVKKARMTFMTNMHNGANVEELLSGLHALEFMTLESNIPEDYQVLIDSAIQEAELRIGLMLSSGAELNQDPVTLLDKLSDEINAVSKIMERKFTYNEIIEFIDKRNKNESARTR